MYAIIKSSKKFNRAVKLTTNVCQVKCSNLTNTTVSSAITIVEKKFPLEIPFGYSKCATYCINVNFHRENAKLICVEENYY